ncbi:hypothetical protein [Sphingopyxis flava]|uniref:Uncharacterized protein n=1 Tax=Sphingopyxis flava TaxID=1507287 RepID=A0A1T5ABW9_9SPHN|nr:hypothetical protein [Sphingopyxis flava]SKB32183.1 hypothetical protein SAMN06295937_100353 [Sphingopyxis flava]
MNWFRRLFDTPRNDQRPRPPRDMRKMNEDWKAGDLAMCVVPFFFPGSAFDPRLGEILRVSEVTEGPVALVNAVAYGLRFHGKPANHAWVCTAFIKIRPEATADEVEEGIIAKIKRAARKGAGVDA